MDSSCDDKGNTYVNRAITDNFRFPVREIPEIIRFNHNVALSDIKNLCHIADGSHSNIFTGDYCGMKVIVKIIKESSVSDPVAEFEFNVESATLARLEHPNIVRLIGAGHSPRLFLILENLLGGTLSNLLKQKKGKYASESPLLHSFRSIAESQGIGKCATAYARRVLSGCNVSSSRSEA